MVRTKAGGLKGQCNTIKATNLKGLVAFIVSRLITPNITLAYITYSTGSPQSVALVSANAEFTFSCKS